MTIPSAHYSPVSPPPLRIVSTSNDIVPPVPAPSTTTTHRTPSPYSRAGHLRSASETTQMFRTSPQSLPRSHLLASSPPRYSTDHQPHPQNASGHAHQHGSAVSQHRPFPNHLAHDKREHANSLLAAAMIPSPSPPYDHAGPSSHRRGVAAQRPVSQRLRNPSGGHERHFRCAPGCTAAEAPYGLLATVIGRASVNDSRKKARITRERRVEVENGEASARPNIQTRRSQSQNRTGIASKPATAPLQSSFTEAALKPLAFDRRLMETPPALSVDPSRLPPASGEYFEAFEHEHESGFFPTHDAAMGSYTSPHAGFDIPRSSSTPEVPRLFNQDRRFSAVSAVSILSSEAGSSQINPYTPSMGEVLQPYALEREDTDVTIRAVSSAHGETGGLETGAAYKPSRFANISGTRIDTEHPLASSFDIFAGKPRELSGYLGPDLAATLRQRMTQNGGETPQVKHDTALVADCSFGEPLAAVLGKTMQTVIAMIPDKDDYHIAEYCCNKETPNAVLADAIKSLCLRSVGINKPKKMFVVTHQCVPDFDLRVLQAGLANDPLSYRRIKTMPSPEILTSFNFAKLTEPAILPRSVDFAICGTELSKLYGIIASKPLNPFTTQAESREQLADRDLTGWLKARAKELKPGGILICSFAIRTSPPLDPEPVHLKHHGIDRVIDQPRASPFHTSMSLPTSPRTSTDAAITPLTEINPSPFFNGLPLPSPPVTDGRSRHFRPDIWQSMSHALSPAIQRLVTLGEIRTHVAPSLVDVPYWPRTLTGTRTTLNKATADWEIIREGDEDDLKRLVGLGIRDGPEMDIDMEQGTHDHDLEQVDEDGSYSPEERREWAEAGVRIHRLTHPAWTAYRQGKIDRAAYARRIASYCRSVYEGHLKKVLREKGRMDIAQSESSVQELFKILVEKCELGALDALEIDIGVVVLRRK